MSISKLVKTEACGVLLIEAGVRMPTGCIAYTGSKHALLLTLPLVPLFKADTKAAPENSDPAHGFEFSDTSRTPVFPAGQVFLVSP